ncbi:MAG TPA: 4,5-dihydroxyphthalate decarboxylase [Pseudonocardiaceae bacterium]|jgi:4,5-dihydroxyphthalate decarboxylase
MLHIGVYQYEHTAALFDGTVTIPGVTTRFETEPIVSDIFRRMVQGEFDIAELGLTYFLRTFDLDDPPFLALPIFPNRNFRHSAIFVHAASGISKPEDLAGRRIGEFALFGHDPGVWMKGVLADEFGVTQDQCDWVIGGTNHPIPAFDWIPQPIPDGVDVRHAEPDQTLAGMLETGDIDALLSVDVPQALLDGSPQVRRLFPDYRSVEQDYYLRTGIFPMMHVIAIRKELANEPDLPRALYQAFTAAKEITANRYREGAVKQHMAVMTPWFSDLFAENRRLLGEDWWPYGLSANRNALDTFLRYHHEQGLSAKRWQSEDIIAPALLGT